MLGCMNSKQGVCRGERWSIPSSEGCRKTGRVKKVLLAQLPETKVFWKDFHASKRVITPFMVNQGQILTCLEDT